MSNTHALPTDVNSVIFEGLYDATGGQFVAKEAGAVVTDGSGNKYAPMVVSPSNQPKAGAIGFSTPPTATTAATDTSLAFTQQVNHWVLQNNSSQTVYFDLDTAASAGSLGLQPGGTWMSDVPVTAVHLYTASAVNINGTSAGNIVVRGWL